MITLANARPVLRIPVASAVLRVAARRGLVALPLDPRRLAVLELRSGRILGEVATDFDIEDFALDPDGLRVALRAPDGAIELSALSEAFAAATALAARRDDAAVAPVPPPLATSDEAGTPPAGSSPVAVGVAMAASPAAAVAAVPVGRRPRTITRPIDLHALGPVAPGAPVAREVALELLDRETRTVALWTLRAIAEAWDTRRIGYGNEGRHPYEHEVAALLGMNRGFAVEHLEAAARAPRRPRGRARDPWRAARPRDAARRARDRAPAVAARARHPARRRRAGAVERGRPALRHPRQRSRRGRSSTRRWSRRSSAAGCRGTSSRRCSIRRSPLDPARGGRRGGATRRGRSPGWSSIRSCSPGSAASRRSSGSGWSPGARTGRSRSSSSAPT